MKFFLLLLTITSSLFLISCNDKEKYNQHALSLLDLINRYGNGYTDQCLPVPAVGPSCANTIDQTLSAVAGTLYTDFELLKDGETHKDGRVVFKNSRNEYIGIDLSGFDDFLSFWESIIPTPKYAKVQALQTFIYLNTKVLTPDGGDHFTFINNHGNPELYSENTSIVKDLEGLAAKLENQTTEILSDKLSAQYGLSNDRAEVVAKNIFAYNKLSSKRALTKKEKDFFANELLGANYDQVMNSFSSGVGVENLLEKAADVNGTSPEQVSAIINELFL